ncbi:hypothetical protein [Virgibacillus pantothenticus]|uniref:Uncharacterized protein n=1 Tax=Virgibacillus pantothenticus TaxID=1473 RepID=A0A0L0QKB5_VIRPA|nr:hypothetical protein [Virgibacillus pantothenticus]KNE19060.1 hypothetical protein AFK71_10900 [Virgibacillus pantothenticus]QTY15504.1 hypothetical protein KBP50_16670 [Virgibacillus pantothenticus]SIT16773.1 hypothetical protein SAMN05421787_12733 [Virgibacillus pantothenticus]
MKQIGFREAMFINLYEPVAYIREYRNGDFDETWFPRRKLWDQKISKLPIHNYTLGEMFNGFDGKWIVEEKE